MRPRHGAARGTIALVVVGALAACTPIEHHTDKQAAMARMTFSREKCEQIGAVYYRCSGEHTLPGASAGGAEWMPIGGDLSARLPL